jgi:putative holliday junction resolvase
MDTFPKTGRLACIDYGTVRIGIAVCDPDRILASPHAVRDGTDWRRDDPYYVQLAKEERIFGWVVGLPIHIDGNESDKSKAARNFGTWLHQVTALPVRMFDERFTTVDAAARLRTSGWTRDKKKKRMDAVAATVLLEAFLEACRYRPETPGCEIEPLPDKQSLLTNLNDPAE